MKLLITDLDECLWEGKILYGKVFLKYETKELLKQLNKLGISIYICSRNNLEDVKKQLDEFGLTKYLDGIRASWEPKSKMIKEILEKTKIVVEETLFIDDEKINRAEISDIIGCHVDFDKDLYNIMKYFDTERLIIMKQERKRTNAEKDFRGTFKEFIDNSGMVSGIRKGHIGMLNRITNLANRTNELNMNRSRYTETQISDILNNNVFSIYVVFLKDIYGDYGLIAEAIIDKNNAPDEWIIQDICVSCRVMGRGIGSKIIEYIKKSAKEDKIKRIIGKITPESENYRIHSLFEHRGFNFLRDEGKTKIYVWNNEK